MSGKGASKDKTAKQTDAKVAMATPPDAASPTPMRQPNGPDEVLGDVVWLMTQSHSHKHLFIADLEWLVLPPVMLRQFRLVRQGGRPFAFISWATVSEEVEARLSKGKMRMSPAEWRCGEIAWIIDLIAPFGGGEQALKEVRERVLPGRKVKTLKVAPEGNGVGVVEW